LALTGRITRLERSRRDAPPAPCRACGAPRGWVPSLMIRNEEGVQLTPTCPKCGFTVMSNGRAVTALRPGSVCRAVILDRLPPG